MSTTKAVLQGTDTVTRGDLCVSFELGDKKWKVTASDGCHTPNQYGVDAGDKEAVLEVCARPRRAASSSRTPWCTRATRPAATAGGCTGG